MKLRRVAKLRLCLTLSGLALASLPCMPAAAQTALSGAELQKIDDYLGDYNKGVLITKRTLSAAGEVVSCVDVNRQPAVTHPNWGARAVQLEPSPQLKALLGGHVAPRQASTLCPAGSVDMRLPTRDQIIARGGLDNFLQKDDGRQKGVGPVRGAPARAAAAVPRAAAVAKPPPPTTMPAPTTSGSSTSYTGHYWASVNANVNAQAAQSTMNIWRPVVPKVADPSKPFLFSLSQMWVNGGGHTGGAGALQSAEAGTYVYQFMYTDLDAHFFIYYTADGYGTASCQDLRCKAFVVTSSVLPIGGKLNGSSAGGTQVEGTIAWFRDPANGNWVLFLHDAVKGYQQVGYYPASIYKGGQLTRNATRVSFGGEVYAPPATAPTLPMGSGINPLSYKGNLQGNVTYQRGLKWMDMSGAIKDFQASSTWMEPGNGCAYGAKFFSAASPYKAGWGSSLFYGGPGYSNACPRP